MKWRVMAGLLSASTIIAFAGAISGTLAWYAYATRASVSYGGTSVYSTAQLQIGLKTNGEIYLVGSDEDGFKTSYTMDSAKSTSSVEYWNLNDDATDYSYPEVVKFKNTDSTTAYTYWFTTPGTGLSEKNIQDYLSYVEPNHLKSGDATTLIPATTRAYKDGDDFKLYQNPSKLEYDHGYASSDNYSKIDFAFRVITSDNTLVKNHNIWLMNARSAAHGTQNSSTTDDAGNAIRLYFEGNRKKSDTDNSREDINVLFNPSDDTAKGVDKYTTVAGLLDLDGDGFYDYSVDNYADDTGTEYLYGYNGTTNPVDIMTQSAGDDINNTGADKLNTFYAKHKQGNKGYLNYDGLDLPKAYYKGQKDIYPDDNSSVLSGGTVLTTTGNDDDAIADLSMTIYMEGWDHSIIDKNIDYTFQLGLTFQINKVD
jgi:hypothetical protein